MDVVMKIGITLDSDLGLEGNVCRHFGQCSHFLIVEIKDGKIIKNEVVPNNAKHGGGCQAVNEILKYNITHIISGGMGGNAQNKLRQANVKIFGYVGKVKDAIEKLLNNSLSSIEECKDHTDCH
jgi:predicted Fe-Mo cluster-binding NifX family protein